jgi:hypothetical protein
MSESKGENGRTYDTTIPPGDNYDQAHFRLWFPDDPGTLRGVLIAASGSNLDSRPWITQDTWPEIAKRRNIDARPSIWQDIATRHGLALLGLHLTDHPHDQMFIEEYCDVRRGSGQALLDALTKLAHQSDHPELADAPLALWGISAGGQYGYEFACWRPELTITFTLNKGGVYYTALAPRATRQIPALLYIGLEDSPFRTDIVKGIHSMNRRADALWALTPEPGAGHAVARSLELSELYLDEVIPLRLPKKPGAPLRPLNLQDGYLGDTKTHEITPYNQEKAKEAPHAWLPTQRTAKAWQAVTTGKPIPP